MTRPTGCSDPGVVAQPESNAGKPAPAAPAPISLMKSRREKVFVMP
jgi:hypothetical protein